MAKLEPKGKHLPMPTLDHHSEQTNADKQICLCKRCVDALRRGRYMVSRIDINTKTRLRSCELCHTRTYCGDYSVSAYRLDDKRM